MVAGHTGFGVDADGGLVGGTDGWRGGGSMGWIWRGVNLLVV